MAGAGAEYAIRLWKDKEHREERQTIPGIKAANVVHVGSGREIVCDNAENGAVFDLADDFNGDANADVFRIISGVDSRRENRRFEVNGLEL